MHVAALQPLHDRAVLFTQLRQQQLGVHLDREVGADRRWDADLAVGTLTFASGPRAVVARAGLIASLSSGSSSLRWAWAVPDVPTGDLSARLRAHGDDAGVPTLSQPEVPLQVLGGESGEQATLAAAHELGAVVTAVTGAAPYYVAPSGEGRFALFALEVPDLAPLRLTPEVPDVIAAVLGSGAVLDHRTAVHGLAELAGWQISWEHGWTSAELTDPVTGSTLAPRFDTDANLVELGGLVR
ncbi:hypothetical protein GCM10027425_26230 [Alteromonas gracilis]